MEGTLEFDNGKTLNWVVSLAIKEANNPLGHRSIAHTFQFEHGSLMYGSTPESDQIIVNGHPITFTHEPSVEEWDAYNIGTLYRKMHRDILASIPLDKSQHLNNSLPLHTISQGINVAYACLAAFESAKNHGKWVYIPLDYSRQ